MVQLLDLHAKARERLTLNLHSKDRKYFRVKLSRLLECVRVQAVL